MDTLVLEKRKKELLAVSLETRMPEMFFCKKFFGRTVLSKKDAIRHDYVNTGSNEAHFGSRHDMRSPKTINKDDSDTQQHTVGKSFEQIRLDSEDDQLEISPGETPYGGISNAYSRDARAIIQLENRNTRLIEKMAVNIATNGTYTNGNYTYNIQRNSALNITNSSADRWNQTSADILQQLVTFSNTMQRTAGVIPDTMVIGQSVLAPLLNNAKIQNLLDNRRIMIGQLSNLSRTSATVFYVGMLPPGLNVYLYLESTKGSSASLDNTFANTDFIFPINKIMLGSSQMQGIKYFGPVKPSLGQRNLVPAQRLIDIYWDAPTKDYYYRIESRPIVFPAMRNSFLTAQVLA